MERQLFFMDDSYIKNDPNMSISENVLLDSGFTKTFSDILQEYSYYIYVPLKHNSNILYRIDVYNYSNTPNRDWYMHVDNEVCSSCGSLDFQTVKHFNTFMELLDINFRLNV